MTSFGLKTLVINGDTYTEALKGGKDLWVEVREGISMILMSPEELASRGFFRLLEDPKFSKRVSGLGVDEVHLLYWWGKSFRPCFQQLGHVRARLPLRDGKRLPTIALTATLRIGDPLNCIHKVLGLVPGHYRLIRRSNVRHDIQLIFREMQSGLASHSFPELDWIITEGDNTVIFCKTIALGFRVVCYLWRRASHLPNRHKRIRLFNSLNWPTFNSDTLGFLNNNEESSITVATDTLSVGWDSKHTRNAVILGEPNDIDEFLQKIGRIGRDHKLVPEPRAFLYFQRTALSTASKVVDAETTGVRPQKRSKGKDSGDTTMDISIARLLLASCKMQAVDEPYNNPKEDPTCTCCTCSSNPPTSRRSKCNCSGSQCKPEQQQVTTEQRSARAPAIRRPRGEAMTKELREHGTKRFERFRWQIFENADERATGMLPPEAFLPTDLIKRLLDYFHLIKDVSDIKAYVQHNPLLDGEHRFIFESCLTLREEFHQLREAKKLAVKSGGQPITDPEDIDSEGDEDSGEETNSDQLAVAIATPDAHVEVIDTPLSDNTDVLDLREVCSDGRNGIRWRVNFS